MKSGKRTLSNEGGYSYIIRVVLQLALMHTIGKNIQPSSVVPKVTCNPDGTLTTPTISETCTLPPDCPEAFQPSPDKGDVNSTGPAKFGEIAK